MFPDALIRRRLRVTPGERRWLEQLRDHGPQVRPRYGSTPMAQCIRLGWSEWVAKQDPKAGERITDAGLAAIGRDT